LVSQVGLDGHLAFSQGKLGSDICDTHRVWGWLLSNEVPYINRLTASEIVTLLRHAGVLIDEIETDGRGDTAPNEVHPDYRNQREADIRR
jgi:hypothetical protein